MDLGKRKWVPQRELSGGVRGEVCARDAQALVSYHSILHGFEVFLASMRFSVLMVEIMVRIYPDMLSGCTPVSTSFV